MINVKTLIDLLLHQYHPSVCVQSIVIEDAPVGASVVIKTRATSDMLGSESTFLLPLEEAERRYSEGRYVIHDEGRYTGPMKLPGDLGFLEEDE